MTDKQKKYQERKIVEGLTLLMEDCIKRKKAAYRRDDAHGEIVAFSIFSHAYEIAENLDYFAKDKLKKLHNRYIYPMKPIED